MHDGAVFRNSPLFEALTNRQNPLLGQQHLIGDSAYPLMLNLMTPFRDNGHLPAAHITYNTKLSSIRSIIERAFGLLKIKWRRLKYLDVSDMDLANKMIASACMLHNFLLDHGEIDHDGRDLYDDDQDHPAMHDQHEVEDRLQIAEAVAKRNAIVAAL